MREVTSSVRVRNPRLWEIGDGELYRVGVEARLGRRVVSRYATHTGIRSLKVDRRGPAAPQRRAPSGFAARPCTRTCRSRGRRSAAADRQQNFGLLQALGATVTRSHYPLHPHTLEMADRAGVLVWDEIPFTREGFAYAAGDQLKSDAALRLRTVRAKGLGFLEAMIRRDQNHASVYAWSIGNEFDSRPGGAQQRYIRAAVAYRQAPRPHPAYRPGHRRLPPAPAVQDLPRARRARDQHVLRLVRRHPGRAHRARPPRPVPGPAPPLLPDARRSSSRSSERRPTARAHRREGLVRVPVGPTPVPPRRLRLEALRQRGDRLDPARLPRPARVEGRQPEARAALEPQGPRGPQRAAQARVRRGRAALQRLSATR